MFKAEKLKVSTGYTIIVIFLATISFAQTMGKGNDVQGKVKLILPEIVYAVPGIESNIYFDNVVMVANQANYIFDITCAKGRQQRERWTYIPLEKDCGDYPLTLDVLDETNTVIASARTTIRVTPSNAGAAKNVTMLIIGDSLTHASVYSQHVLDLCENSGNPSITLIGSHFPIDSSGVNRHEGYGGWTAKRFATHYTGTARTGDYKERGSPFIYKDSGGEPKLDFARYCREFNGGNAPDIVTIFLGPNDVFSADDSTIENRIDEMLTHYDTLIKMVHGFKCETIVGVFLPVPPAASQDAFGANYACGQTRWQYKRNQHHLVDRMLKHYSGRESENICIVPANVNLDCVHNYPTHKMPCNDRTSEQVIRLNNGVHPADQGYRQIGDTLYAWLKAQLNKTSN